MKFNEFINEARVVPGSKKDLENIRDFAVQLKNNIHDFAIISSDFMSNTKNKQLTDAYWDYRKYDLELENYLKKLITAMDRTIQQN